MGARVAIVTDSSAYLSAEQVDRHHITVVPLQVVIGDTVRAEGVDITAAEAAQALRERQPITTSRPSPKQFVLAYEAAADAGADGIVSVHLSAAMSGTVDAARLAAADAPVPIRVIDSRGVGMGVGFAALAGAEAARAGATLAEVAAAVERRARVVRSLFYVASLEHLRRGGRIGAAAGLLGSALMVKPLLHIVDGRVAPLEKVRTASRALARLEDLAVQQAADQVVDVAVQHMAASAKAAALAARLNSRIPRVRDVSVGEVGPVIGAHAGPGMLGVVIAPALEPP
jgi:DegV family protein with EDD domain